MISCQYEVPNYFFEKKIKYLDAIFDMMRTAYSMLGT